MAKSTAFVTRSAIAMHSSESYALLGASAFGTKIGGSRQAVMAQLI